MPAITANGVGGFAGGGGGSGGEDPERRRERKATPLNDVSIEDARMLMPIGTRLTKDLSDNNRFEMNCPEKNINCGGRTGRIVSCESWIRLLQIL